MIQTFRNGSIDPFQAQSLAKEDKCLVVIDGTKSQEEILQIVIDKIVT